MSDQNEVPPGRGGPARSSGESFPDAGPGYPAAPQYPQPQHAQPQYGPPQYPQPQYPPYGNPPYPYPPWPLPPRPLAQGGGYPCDPALGDLAVAGLGPVRRAGLGMRLLARVVDAILVSAVLGLLVVGFLFGLDGAEQMDSGEPSGWVIVTMLLLFFVVVPLAPLVYEVTMIARKGATLGKMLCGLRVIRLEDGAVPGAGTSILRCLLPIALVFTCGFAIPLVYLSPVFDSSPAKQGWHDMLGKTMVITVR